MTNVAVVLSGGMDSATALWQAASTADAIEAVTVNYGQRHIRELDAAVDLCRTVPIPTNHTVLDLSAVGRLLTGSALTDTVDVPHGNYADDTMRATVVPGRNTLLVAAAAAVAQARGCRELWVGIHAGDHPVYPDCRPEWAETMASTLAASTEGTLKLRTPFLYRTKADIVQIGHDLGVPYEATWSCYEGGDTHCGRCGTCVERAEAFDLAGVPDPTTYTDAEFWRTATA